MNDILREAFRHSAWATKKLIAACRDLPLEQLQLPARGFGSLLATLNHVVTSDADYAAILTGVRPAWTADATDLDEIAARVDRITLLWEQLLAAPLDAERVHVLDAGAYECHASVVVAQALHHGAAHREQVRAGLKELGVPPPDLQPWEYALQAGRARWRNR